MIAVVAAIVIPPPSARARISHRGAPTGASGALAGDATSSVGSVPSSIDWSSLSLASSSLARSVLRSPSASSSARVRSIAASTLGSSISRRTASAAST